MRIGVYGNLTLDELERDGKRVVRPGGSAFYASLAVAYLGAKVSVNSNVGHDYPRQILSSMRKRGVEIHDVGEFDGPTTRFRISYTGSSRRLELIHPGQVLKPVNDGISPNAIHLGPVFREVGVDTLDYARRHAKFLSVDIQGLLRTTGPAGFVRLVKTRIEPFMSKCDLIKATVQEARVLAPAGTIVSAARKLLAKGARYAIVTQGRSGSLLLERDGGAFHVPSFPERRVADPTGAGDIFTGSWLATFLSVKDTRWAAAVGAAFASLSTRGTGFSKFRFARNELFRRASWVCENSRLIKG